MIADCTGDNAGDSVGPSADGFETYGVTGVALITFILLGVKDPTIQVQLLVWIFVMRIAMLVSSAAAYFINGAIAKARFGTADKMNFETPLTWLVWLTSLISVAVTFVISAHHSPASAAIPRSGGSWPPSFPAARWRGHHSRTGEGLHLDRVAAREGSRDLRQRRRRIAGHPVRLRGRKFLRLLSRTVHGRA